MAQLSKSLVLRLLTLTLRPAVRFCIRHSIKLQDLIECAKVAFVDAAAKELERAGHKPNVSRMSVMTGVHRRDIMRVQSEGLDSGIERDLVTKVMGQWRTDRRFLTKSGQPRVLSSDGERSEFKQLCESVSQDINPGTVLFELQRVHAVEAAKGGLKLVHESYVPAGDPAAGFSILAEDCESLLDSVEENVISPSDLPQFHARTSYDNVRPEAAHEIKRWFLKEGHLFHARIRDFLGQFDQDINPDAKFKGKGLKVVFGAFGNVQKPEKEKEDT